MPRFQSRRYAPRKQLKMRKRRLGAARRLGATSPVGAKYNTQVRTLQPYVARNPFPPGQHLRGNYCEAFTLSTGLAVYGSAYNIRLNSIYDPNQTGAGHTVYGYSNIAALYNKYRVDMVEWEIVLTTPGGTNDQYITATVAPNTSGSIGGATIYNPMEDPSSVTGLMSSSGDRRAIISGVVDCATACGVSKAKYRADDTFSSGIASNPAQILYLNFATCAADGTNGLSSQALLRMTFHYYVYDRTTVN